MTKEQRALTGAEYCTGIEYRCDKCPYINMGFDLRCSGYEDLIRDLLWVIKQKDKTINKQAVEIRRLDGTRMWNGPAEEHNN